MRSSVILLGALVAAACTRPGAMPACSPAASFTAPALRCVTTGAPVVEITPPESQPARPRVEVTEKEITLSETVQFEVDSATLLPQSKSLLDEVAAQLQRHPEITKVEIDGHTDSTASREYNQKLSERRAAAVKDYLVQQGIAAERLTTRGFGKDRPIADNRTEEGRFKNRRVELKILERR